jgi:carbon storage regulator
MRKSGQSLLIGDNIEIQIIDVQPNGVKIGISAPRDIRVLRRELLTEAEKANRESAIAAKVSLSELNKILDKKD